jgi:hypothetical protein
MLIGTLTAALALCAKPYNQIKHRSSLNGAYDMTGYRHLVRDWLCDSALGAIFATISSGLCRFFAIAVLLGGKAILRVGPLHWEWIIVTPLDPVGYPTSQSAVQNAHCEYL